MLHCIYRLLLNLKLKKCWEWEVSGVKWLALKLDNGHTTAESLKSNKLICQKEGFFKVSEIVPTMCHLKLVDNLHDTQPVEDCFTILTSFQKCNAESVVHYYLFALKTNAVLFRMHFQYSLRRFMTPLCDHFHYNLNLLSQ